MLHWVLLPANLPEVMVDRRGRNLDRGAYQCQFVSFACFADKRGRGWLRETKFGWGAHMVMYDSIVA